MLPSVVIWFIPYHARRYTCFKGNNREGLFTMVDHLRALYRSNAAPLSFLGAMGIGSLVMVIDSYSVPAISHVSASSNGLPTFSVSLAVLVAFFLLYMRSNRKDIPVAAVLILGILSSGCSMASSFEIVAGNPLLDSVLDVLFALGKGALMLFWVQVLAIFGARKSATTFAFGIMFFAALSTATLMLREDLARAIITVLPLVSSLCLLAFQRLNKEQVSSETSNLDSLLVHPCTNPTHNWFYYIASTFIPIVCFAITFSELHNAWVDIQDGSLLSLIIQVGILFGSFAGGCIALCLVFMFWSRENVHLLKASLPMILLFAFWFLSSNSGIWVFSRLALLNVTHKLVYLLMWITPFMFELGRNRLTPFCFSYAAFEIGKGLSTVLKQAPLDSEANVATALILTILILCSVLPPLIYNSLEKTAIDRVAFTQPTRVTYFRNAIQAIAELYGLTPRETEILWYLGKGFTSTYLADRLCISPATAKTHQKNIYTKLKLHSQQELILLIDSTISEQRAQETQVGATSA